MSLNSGILDPGQRIPNTLQYVQGGTRKGGALAGVKTEAAENEDTPKENRISHKGE